MKYIQFIWPKRGCIKFNTSICQCKMLKANTSTNKGQPLTHPKDMYNVMISYRKNMNSRVNGGNFLHSESKQHSNDVLNISDQSEMGNDALIRNDTFNCQREVTNKCP